MATVVESAAEAAKNRLDYPSGHLGHLSEKEEAAFAEFKRQLTEQQMYKPGPPSSHADQDLIRFLRARRWEIEAAISQFASTEKWRAANEIDLLYHTIDHDAYRQSWRLYPQWTGRRDKRGTPLYVFDIKPLDSKTVEEHRKSAEIPCSRARLDAATSPTMMRLFALYENMTSFMFPFCTQLQDRPNSETPISLATNIVDVTGVGLSQYFNLRDHMQKASQLASSHYPESLDRIFIIGAPRMFYIVWGWISNWFDPVTVSKIFVLKPNEVGPVLRSFFDPASIPRKYGGELDWSYGDPPAVDPAWREQGIEWAPGHSAFTTSPCIWREVDGGARLECVRVGCADGKDHEERICTIPRSWTPPPPTVSDAAPAAAVNGTKDTDDAVANVGGSADRNNNGDANGDTNGDKNGGEKGEKGGVDGDGDAYKMVNGNDGGAISSATDNLSRLVVGDKTKSQETAKDVPAAIPSTIV